jgi:hypothetical protein
MDCWSAHPEGRFFSEFGVQSVSDVVTLLAATAAETLQGPFIENAFLRSRQHRETGNTEILNAVMSHFALTADVSVHALWFPSQINQAMCLKNLMNSFKMHTDGAIVWQLNDIWPTISWSIVDYYTLPKLAFYFLNDQGVLFARAGDFVTIQANNATVHFVNYLTSLSPVKHIQVNGRTRIRIPCTHCLVYSSPTNYLLLGSPGKIAKNPQIWTLVNNNSVEVVSSEYVPFFWLRCGFTVFSTNGVLLEPFRVFHFFVERGPRVTSECLSYKSIFG